MQNHDCTFEYLNSELRVHFQTDKQLMSLFMESAKLCFPPRTSYVMRPIKLFHYRQPLFFRTDSRGDMLAPNHIMKTEDIFIIKEAKVISCAIVNQILHILDSNLDLRRLRYGTKAELYFPRLIWSDITSLLNLTELKSVLHL